MIGRNRENPGVRFVNVFQLWTVPGKNIDWDSMRNYIIYQIKRKSPVCPPGKRYGKQNTNAEHQYQFFDYFTLFHIDPLPVTVFTYR